MQPDRRPPQVTFASGRRSPARESRAGVACRPPTAGCRGSPPAELREHPHAFGDERRGAGAPRARRGQRRGDDAAQERRHTPGTPPPRTAGASVPAPGAPARVAPPRRSRATGRGRSPDPASGQLPAEVHGVLDPGVHPLAPGRRGRMRCVAGEERHPPRRYRSATRCCSRTRADQASAVDPGVEAGVVDQALQLGVRDRRPGPAERRRPGRRGWPAAARSPPPPGRRGTAARAARRRRGRRPPAKSPASSHVGQHDLGA